jgi:hypothetical protein
LLIPSVLYQLRDDLCLIRWLDPTEKTILEFRVVIEFMLRIASKIPAQDVGQAVLEPIDGLEETRTVTAVGLGATMSIRSGCCQMGHPQASILISYRLYFMDNTLLMGVIFADAQPIAQASATIIQHICV